LAARGDGHLRGGRRPLQPAGQAASCLMTRERALARHLCPRPAGGPPRSPARVPAAPGRRVSVSRSRSASSAAGSASPGAGSVIVRRESWRSREPPQGPGPGGAHRTRSLLEDRRRLGLESPAITRNSSTCWSPGGSNSRRGAARRGRRSDQRDPPALAPRSGWLFPGCGLTRVYVVHFEQSAELADLGP
jgi:hypothetical protein